MSIVNVNSFESRVSNENYLTTYTNEYLRQSLANLGQRLSVKGDSITSASFKIKDLFNNYLESFSRENMLAEFKYNPVTTYITANLMLVGDKGQRTALTSSTIDNRADANSYFELTDTNGVIFPNKDNYDGDFMLPDNAGVNSSKYWHRDGSIIAKVFDKEENSDALLFKITGHASNGSKGDYDNEYICNEVTTKGEFVSGFRICMSNERNLMIDDESDSKDGKYENLVMLWLKKNPKYVKDSKDNDKKHQWLLSCYKANINKMDIGHFTEITNDDIAVIAKEAFDNTGTLKPDDIANAFIRELSTVAISITQSTQPLFSKVYELGIDFDTNSNVSWSLPDDQAVLIKDYELCENPYSKDQKWKNADQNDTEFIRTKLNYFTADLTQIFPVMQSAYDTIVYHDADNLKLKRQIIAELVKQCYNEFASTEQTGSELQKLYTVCMPVDLTIKYNGNSNDSSIIYNTVSSISVQFVPIGSDEEGAIDINTLLYSISNHADQDGNIIDNKQLVIANGKNSRSALYDLNIEYIDDKIVDNISWYQTFQLPYIDSKGTWIVNGIDTQVSAKGSNDNSSGLVIISSGINHNSFIPESDIIFSADKDALALFDWQKQNFATDYIDDNGNIGSNASFIMQAYLPTEESLDKYAQTSYISYLTNSLIMVMSSVKDEKDNIVIECVYNDASYNDVSTIYKDRYEKYGTTYYLGTYEGKTVPSYIYTKHYKEDSLAYLLGTDAVVTSFWKCEKVSNGANTTYKMTYLRKPNNSLVALDIPFMASFEKYIKHYANSAFSPDNYKHRWLVFDQVNTELKNNTLDDIEKLFPLIRNYDSTYFSKVGLDPSRALGEAKDNTEELQYQNDLNLSIEFTNAIHKNSDNEIIATYNSLDGRRFEIGQDYRTINQPLTYVDTYIDDNKQTHTYLAQRIDQIKEKYGYIPYSIPYTYFEKEYIPNSKYDANSDVKRNVYPLLNLKEVLVHNINTLNRTNLISVAREKFNGDITKTLLYYAYIGVPFDSDDKSHLKIGTSNIDPNLGTTTMTSYDSLKRLTPMKSVDVEFSYINLAGDTFVSGNLTTDKTQWQRKEVKDHGLDVVTYSTIAKPIGVLQEVNKNDDTPLDTNFSLLSEVHFKTDEQNYPYLSRYYKNTYTPTKIGHNNDAYRSISYLNVNKLLEENGIAFDSQTCFYGDSTVLTKRAGTYVGDEVFNAKVALSNFAINYYGAFCDLVRYVNDDKNSTDLNVINNLNWYGLISNNATLRNYIQNKGIVEFKKNIIEPCLKYTGGIFTTWHHPNNSDEFKSCYLGIKKVDNKQVQAYFDITDNRIDETFTFVEDTYAPYYDTSSMRLTYAGWFLELSTDLCNNENRQFANKYWKDNEGDTRRIVASNPIQISYTDIYSYDIISNVPKYKKVYAYMFVDGSKEKDAKYTARYATENNENAKKKVELDEGHENYSYNEVWSCSGCDLCSNYTCKLIGICNHSSVQGSYKPSFGFFVIDDDNKLKGNDLTQYLQSKADEHVYKYQHKRMGQNDDSTTYTYFVDAYYPIQEYVAVVGNRDQRFNKVKRIVEGKTEYLDWKGAWITYDPMNKGYDISEPAYVIPVGHNIVCTYDYIYVAENNKLALGTSTYYKISKNKSNVTYSVSGTTTETKTAEADINGTYTYSWADENPTYTYVSESTTKEGTVISKLEVFKPGATGFYAPEGKNNVSSYTYSYLKIKKGQQYEDKKPYSYDNPIMTTWDEYYELQDGATIEDTHINISYKTTNSEKTSFSYMELREGEDTQIIAKLTRRHINVRELMTNNSDVQYFNGDLSNGLIDEKGKYTLPKNDMDPASLNEMKPDIQPIVKDKDGNIVSGEKVNTMANTAVNISESKDKKVNNG